MSHEDGAEDKNRPPTLFGTTYPLERVTGMFPTLADAQAAAAGLERDGVALADIVVATGEQLLRNEQALHQRLGLRDRLLSHFPSEESRIVKEYTELAAGGHAVVAAYVPEVDINRRDQVAATLHQHGAINVLYWGKHTTVDL